ncbi:MAG: hypothetical protein MJ188_04465, partial [Treponema sp.]|nr:hypothetical protein [Treponema sp.]
VSGRKKAKTWSVFRAILPRMAKLEHEAGRRRSKQEVWDRTGKSCLPDLKRKLLIRTDNAVILNTSMNSVHRLFQDFPQNIVG